MSNTSTQTSRSSTSSSSTSSSSTSSSSTSKPTLSVCLIVGNAHVGVLVRALTSLLRGPDELDADEIVIDWNGIAGRETAFMDAVTAALGSGSWAMPAVLGGEARWTTTHLKTRVVIARGADPREVGFDAARNANFARATGEWRMYMDADDVLVDATHPAYEDSCEQDPPRSTVESFPVKGTLPEFLRSLPLHVNVVKAPYNYLNDAKTLRPLIRNKRPRIVRWDPYWTWMYPIHEQLVHLLEKEVAIWAPGIVLFHDSPEKEEVRVERNFKVLGTEISRLDAEKIEVSHGVLYGQAVHAMSAGLFLDAIGLFRRATEKCNDREMRALYLIAAGRCHLLLEQPSEAGKLAIETIELAPNRPEGYLLASEAAYAMKRYDYCIQWYEAGGTKSLPSAPLTDHRMERCLYPVRSVGLSYLKMKQFEKALAVAEIALKETPDEFAERLKKFALEGIAYSKLATDSVLLAKNLVDLGFAHTALKMLDVVEPALSGNTTFGEPKAKIRRRMANVDAPLSIPEGPVLEFLTTSGADDVGVAVPVDASEEPAELIRLAAKRVGLDGVLKIAATDPANGDPYAVATRSVAFDAEQMLAALDAVGDTTTLALIEGFVVAETRPGRGVVEAVGQRTGVPDPWVPDFTFFCPVAAEPWGPWRVLKDGTGGSEESVVYFSRKLAEQGYNVQVYAVLDPVKHRGVHVEGKVRWYPVDSVDPSVEVPGITIACRAPWAVRFPAFPHERLYVWHQDAAYQMGWNAHIARAVRHLWVSKWQRDVLLAGAGLRSDDPTIRGCVIGNGVPDSALDVPFPKGVLDADGDPVGVGGRDPLSVVYTSSPLRGLTHLLDVWPDVLKAHPGATLRIYYGWETAQMAGASVPDFRKKIDEKISQTKNVEFVGRVSQFELERDLVGRGVWSYPVQFDEGYCIAGVRAAAAGLVPVYRKRAAMAECQFPNRFAVDDTPWEQGGREEYTNALIVALNVSMNGSFDREAARDWARTKEWHVAAGLFLDFWTEEHRGSDPLGAAGAEG